MAKHQALAARLWALQDDLRIAAIPGARPLKATDEALTAVAKILDDYSPEDCEHALRVYAAEARSKPEQRQWFNGETNWRPANFRRALGRSVGDARASPQRRGQGAELFDMAREARAQEERDAAERSAGGSGLPLLDVRAVDVAPHLRGDS